MHGNAEDVVEVDLQRQRLDDGRDAQAQNDHQTVPQRLARVADERHDQVEEDRAGERQRVLHQLQDAGQRKVPAKGRDQGPHGLAGGARAVHRPLVLEALVDDARGILTTEIEEIVLLEGSIVAGE